MKLITAIIQPDKIDDVVSALAGVGVHGLTISEAHGYGRQHGHTEVFRGTSVEVDILPKVRFEIVAEDAAIDSIVNAICVAAGTNTIGDGKVWVILILYCRAYPGICMRAVYISYTADTHKNNIKNEPQSYRLNQLGSTVHSKESNNQKYYMCYSGNRA